jgi:hypothetical protein
MSEPHHVSVSVASTMRQLRSALKRELKYEPNLAGSSSFTFPRSSEGARRNVNALILKIGLDDALECTEVELTGRSDVDAVFIDLGKSEAAANERFFAALEILQKTLG